MEILIATSHKRLTKSMVNQMKPTVSIDIITNGKVLGYVYNVVKDMGEAILIEHDGCYYRLAKNWNRSSKADSVTIYRKLSGRWSASHDFDTLEELDTWWNRYSEIIEGINSKKIHQIFI